MDGPVTAVPTRRHSAVSPGQMPAFLAIVALHLLPALLLGVTAYRTDRLFDILGGASAALAVLGVVTIPLWPINPALARIAVITVYLFALAGSWSALGPPQGRFSYLLYGLLLQFPVAIYCVHFMHASGAVDRRRAQQAASALAQRAHWPEQLADCRTLPEVETLRNTLGDQPETALALLDHKSPCVRVAALSALAHRPRWRSLHADMVMRIAKSAENSVERSSAIMAIAATEDRFLVEAIAGLLNDADSEVRKSAVEALCHDIDRRWNWIRFHVHSSLNEQAHYKDGPLSLAGVVLPTQALNDLTGWTSEAGLVSTRAAQTLIAYYKQSLETPQKPEILGRLKKQVLDPSVAAVLRVEVGQLLVQHQGLSVQDWEQLLEASQPALLRMMAADQLLAAGPSEGAVWALRDLARLQNRDLAMQIARIVQSRLNVNLGLTGATLPPPQSRQAADITRKTYDWAVSSGEDASSGSA